MLKLKILDRWLDCRNRKKKPTTLVVHATAGSSLAGAIETLKKRRLSYHYIIDKQGTITKCVPEKKVAYHAGISTGPEGEGVNEYSVGISFVNKNDGKDPYTQEQIGSLKELCKTLTTEEHTFKYLTTHRQISWPRKNDPVGASTFLRKIALALGLTYWAKEGIPE